MKIELRNAMLCILACLVFVIAGCGDDDDSGPDDGGAGDSDTDSDTDTDGDSDSDGDVSPECAALVDGMNTGFPVGDEAYDLILHIPDGAADDGSGDWAVVFNWHSLGTSAEAFDDMISGNYNNSEMPFIGVSPDSNGHDMVIGDMTWDVFNVDPENNGEIALFDKLLECFDARFGIDGDHIHSMGFSLGGIVTDMLATTRGNVIASVATYSGGYFSNASNVSTLGMLAGQVNWPAPTHSNGYTQLMCNGGVNDNYNVSVVTIHFDQFGTNDVPYLTGIGHDVIHCVNSSASQHGDLAGLPSTMDFVRFFLAHPMGTEDSPYASGLPSSGYDLCTFHPKS